MFLRTRKQDLETLQVIYVTGEIEGLVSFC